MNVNTLCCSLKHLFSHGFVQWDEALHSRFRCRVNVISLRTLSFKPVNAAIFQLIFS